MRIFISDRTQGEGTWTEGTFDGPTAGPSAEFRQELEAEYGQKFSFTSIGTGAAEAAYFTELVSNPAIQASVAVFFARGAIGSAAEGWLWLYSQLAKFFQSDPVVDREAAAILVYKAVVDRMEGVPKTYQLKGFAIQHRLSYADPSNPPNPDPPATIEQAPERVERAMINVFQVVADGREFLASCGRW